MPRTIGSYSSPEQFKEAVRFFGANNGGVGATLIHRHLTERFPGVAVVEKTVARWMPAIRTKSLRIDGLWRWQAMPEGLPYAASRLLMDCKLEYDQGKDEDPEPEDYLRSNNRLIFSNRMATWAYRCHQLDPTWWPSVDSLIVNELVIMAEGISDAEMNRDLGLRYDHRSERMWMAMLMYRPHLNTEASSLFYERLSQGEFDFDADMAIHITVRRDRLLNPATREGAESEWWVRRYRADSAWQTRFHRKGIGDLIRLQSREEWVRQFKVDPDLASKLPLSLEEILGYLDEGERK